MEIQKVVDPNDYQVGVVVARFQVDRLHDQQREMLDIVMSNHKKVIIFLGVPRTPATRRNPLDFLTRQYMLQKHYPTATILPLQDRRSNLEWSNTLDNKIREIFSGLKPLLYGSRDSFIPYYEGKHTTTELTSTLAISGTEIREKISKEVLSSSKFRAGVIHAIYSLPPKVHPTVDVAAYNNEGQILLALKPDEDKYRFIGGFVDVTDNSYEITARREFSEEVSGSNVNNLRPILSQKVDDWRYGKEIDGIMTTLFLGSYNFGQIKASDDIIDVKWFDISDLSDPEYIKRHIMEEHQDMMAKLIQIIYEQDLVKSKGEFYRHKSAPIDPDVVQPSEHIVDLKEI